MGGYCREIPFPDILRPAKSGSQQPRLFTSGFSLQAFHFWLSPQNCFALCLKHEPLASKGNPLSCKIADDFKDDLNDDRVRKGCRSAERSTVSARQTAMA
jgi:hypothetical protein